MKISIITINLNNAEGLSKTIASVCHQTYSDIEYIIIDGGSTDGSIKVINNSIKDLYYWISEKDRGMYEAMNKGIAKATGNYLLFLNSGDTLSNAGIINKIVPLLDNKEIVYGNINVMHNGQVYDTLIYPDSLTFNYFIAGSIPHQGMFIKRSVFNLVGHYAENLKICSDWKFQLDSICKYKCSYKHLNIIITDFLGGGISARKENQILIRKEKESVLIGEYSLFKEDLLLLKKYTELGFYYQNSRRIQFLKKLKVLKTFLTAG